MSNLEDFLITVVLWIFFFPATLMDLIWHKKGGVFGGNLVLYFSSAFLSAVWITGIIGLVVYLFLKG
jgi:hypothetical protein